MRKKLVYICQECGTEHLKWVGKCEACNTWNSITSQEVNANKKNTNLTESVHITSLTKPLKSLDRINTGINEMNRVLGGGLVKGAAILIAGEPGIGKSTLLLQLAALMSQSNAGCLYSSGEESIEQIQLRAMRLELSHADVQLLASNALYEILEAIKKIPNLGLLIVDSIQTVKDDNIASAAGTVGQVKHCAMELIAHCKKYGLSLIIVGHITKDGQIAGPKILEHMVDTVIYFEGDNTQQFRMIRAIKNRYGPTNEIGIFEMSASGLNEVKNPSSMFMPSHCIESSGSAIFAGIEGTRPMMVEIQALVSPSFLATPRRSAIGWDVNRLAMMIAILGARYGLSLSDKEVYLNIVGGIKITEPAADLAVMAALISAASNTIISREMIFFGEIGLSGEVRQVNHYENRLNEAMKLAIKRAIMPAERKVFACKIEKFWVKHISDLKRVIAANNR